MVLTPPHLEIWTAWTAHTTDWSWKPQYIERSWTRWRWEPSFGPMSPQLNPRRRRRPSSRWRWLSWASPWSGCSALSRIAPTEGWTTSRWRPSPPRCSRSRILSTGGSEICHIRWVRWPSRSRPSRCRLFRGPRVASLVSLSSDSRQALLDLWIRSRFECARPLHHTLACFLREDLLLPFYDVWRSWCFTGGQEV